MKFLIKKTEFLTTSEKKDYCALFNKVFNKTFSVDSLERKYGQGRSSYHALMLQREKIVGAYSAIPYRYNFFNKEYRFALSVDTMIEESARTDIFSFKRMADLVYGELRKDGIPFVFGFPNDNSYLYFKKILHWKDIGTLNFYALPIRVGALQPGLRHLDFLSRAFCGLLNAMPLRQTNTTPAEFPIDKIIDEAFLRHRYGEGYQKIELNGVYGYYKTYTEENGARTLFIIDCEPLEKRALRSLVQEIYKREASNTDVIMYIGRLNFRHYNLFRVPERLSPRKIYMTGRVLIDGPVDGRVFDISNWKVNLSNFDVR